jgi:hypothetical protein
MKKKYMITRRECQNRIKERMPVVCSQCGGKIKPIKTVDNSGHPTYWSGCLLCGCFDGGVHPKIYRIAELIVSDGFVYYPHLIRDRSSIGEERFKLMQIGGATDLVWKILKYEKIIDNE